MRCPVLALVLLAACTRSPEPTTPTPSPAPPLAPAAHVASAGALVHISDDFEEAKRVALVSGKILFVDAWAPWCHTCWSMKREVLSDPALDAYGDRVLAVELDTDKPQNAAFVALYPVRNWPTFFAIDPAAGNILQAQGGSMSLPETMAFLDRALAVRAGAMATAEDKALAAGYASLQAGDPTAAAAHFLQVRSGPRRTEAIFAAVRALREAKDMQRCTEVAHAGLDVVQGSASPGDLASYVLLCSSEMPKDAPQRATARTAAREKLEQLVASPPAGATVDDKADMMANLAELYEEIDKKDDAMRLHVRRLRMLEDDAAIAPTPQAARTHDYARMNSYLALGRGEDAVKLFRQRIDQFPDDYENYARLASTLNKMQRYEDALPVAEKAVALSYGPRKLGYLKLLADIHGKLRSVEGERAALDALIAANDAMPDKLRKPELAAQAKARLVALHP